MLRGSWAAGSEILVACPTAVHSCHGTVSIRCHAACRTVQRVWEDDGVAQFGGRTVLDFPRSRLTFTAARL